MYLGLIEYIRVLIPGIIEPSLLLQATYRELIHTYGRFVKHRHRTFLSPRNIEGQVLFSNGVKRGHQSLHL